MAKKDFKTLIMERYDFSATVLNTILKDLGADSKTFMNPESLMERIEKEAPLLLFYDYESGNEEDERTLKEIAKRFPKTRIILINYAGQEINLEKIKQDYGIFEIVQRPFSRKQISNVLQKFKQLYFT